MTRTWFTRRALVAAALVVPLALSACGTPEAGSAAVVGDRRISVSDVQNATADITAFYSPQPVDQQQVLFFLIAGPYIEQAAVDAGVGFSADDAKRDMKSKLATPTDAGVEVYRANQSISNITKIGDTDQKKAQDIVNAIRAALQTAKITVNPRYGKFDSKNLNITPDPQNWIAPGPSTSPSAGTQPAPAESGAASPEPAPSAS